jgi:glutathione S-transferase
MDTWVEVSAARAMSGVRIVMTKGIPNPWAHGAKALLDVKKIPYVGVTQRGMTPNADLLEWTGQTSSPAVVVDDERPRTHWSEIIHLAERLAPEPALIPSDSAERAAMFGYLHEVCGELGFGWCRRMQFTHEILADPESPIRAIGEYTGGRYGYGQYAPEVLAGRVGALLELFGTQLRRQRERGSRFFIGDRLTALDLYWAAFAALIEPLPPEQCPMFDVMRPLYTLSDPALRPRVDPALLAHRDWIYSTYLPLPVPLR